ncbi:MAG: FimB/Mfa2 family fimbrial subunit [Bacteroides sp.]|nr:FimB/Mfa2 family fimbrial subunit [Bacteroides sp.]
MKPKSFILPSFALALALSSCNAIYEDLAPCPQGVEISLAFTNNMEGVDRVASDVHCSNIFIYDGNGDLYGHYDLDNSNRIDLELPAGNYRAIAFGGMRCDDASFDFSHHPEDFHNYADLLAYIRGTRAPESNARLHDQFHVASDFSVDADDMTHRSMTLDYIRNTNNIRVGLDYEDGTSINPADFNFSITADNYVTDHANNVIPQGADCVYTPCAQGTTPAAGDARQYAWAEISTGRLTSDSNARLKITSASDGKTLFDVNLVEYIAKIHPAELPGTNLQEYLDRQNNWTVKFSLEPSGDKIAGLVITINGWIINLSNTNVDL